jgi:hypothetical protein
MHTLGTKLTILFALDARCLEGIPHRALERHVGWSGEVVVVHWPGDVQEPTLYILEGEDGELVGVVEEQAAPPAEAAEWFKKAVRTHHMQDVIRAEILVVCDNDPGILECFDLITHMDVEDAFEATFEDCAANYN